MAIVHNSCNALNSRRSHYGTQGIWGLHAYYILHCIQAWICNMRCLIKLKCSVHCSGIAPQGFICNSWSLLPIHKSFVIPIELKQKPQGKPALYGHRPRVKAASDAPKTSAITVKACHTNLTLQDWMMVFAYVDAHPNLGQSHIVQHFCTKQDDALLLDQATLSWKLKSRAELEWALVLWNKQMEDKWETVTGPMLQEKHKRFEEAFNVPEDECLNSDWWIPSFCKVWVSHVLEFIGLNSPQIQN